MNILSTAEEAAPSLSKSGPVFGISGTAAKPRILYVDDDESVREIGQQLLGRFGYEVDVAADGDEALAALRGKPYQLLITDQSMPHCTGAELIEQVRQKGMRLPIVVTSQIWRMRSGGTWPHVDAVLPKPFAAAELLGAVKQVLGRATGLGPAEQAIRSLVKGVADSKPSHRNWGINE